MPSQENLDENYQQQVNTVEDINFEETREFSENPPTIETPQHEENSKELTIFIPINATVEERLMFMSYLGDSEPLWNYPGETLVIVGVAAFDDWKRDKNGVELLDEDGALIPCKRTVWKGQLGKLWHSTSNVAYAWCKRFLWPIMTYDNKPGDLVAPIKIKIGRRPTKKGNNTFKFDIVSE